MKIGLIGFGKMGSSIFKLLAGTQHSITLVFRTEEKAAHARDAFFKKLERSVKRKTLSAEEHEQKLSAIVFTHSYEKLSDADMVLENVVEDNKVKSELFQLIESIIKPSAVLATGTSSISIKQMASILKYPDRFCGYHFFHPVFLINLIEIICHDHLNDDVINALRGLSSDLGKQCIVVKDAPGSVINAILTYYYMESLYILDSGLALPSKIDEISRKLFYIGPCESMDVIGIDFIIEAIKNGSRVNSTYPFNTAVQLHAGSSDDDLPFYVPSILIKLLSQERFGKKASAGIYCYEKEIPFDDAPLFYLDSNRIEIESGDVESYVMDRLLFGIYSGVLFSIFSQLASSSDLDIGIKEVLQMKTGPVSLMKMMGIDIIKNTFQLLASRTGKRFEISQDLLDQIPN